MHFSYKFYVYMYVFDTSSLLPTKLKYEMSFKLFCQMTDVRIHSHITINIMYL